MRKRERENWQKRRRKGDWEERIQTGNSNHKGECEKKKDDDENGWTHDANQTNVSDENCNESDEDDEDGEDDFIKLIQV